MNLPKLNFPEYKFKFQTAASNRQSLKIFDIIRKKYVSLTPEEWVRQHLLHFMVNERKFPQSLLSVEKKLLVNGLEKRSDVVVYTSSLKPIMIVECKAPTVALSERAFNQAARYNMTFGVMYFLISNGLETQCCKIDHENQTYVFLKNVPFYQEIET